MFTKAHKRKYQTTDEDLAYVSALNHKNAQDNPASYNSKKYTLEDVMNSKRLTDDLKLLDCSRSCYGSSAVLLASEKVAKRFTDTPVWIEGIGQKTTSASFTKNDLTRLNSTIDAASQAYSMAKITPDQIDVVEIHDAFSVCELMILEGLGIVPEGQASKLVRESYQTDNKKINPRGGLIGSGHPLGATGLAQISEIASQITGSSSKRQVENAKIGLVQNMSEQRHIIHGIGNETMNFESELKKGRFVVGECARCHRVSWPPSESCSSFGELVWRQVRELGIIIECSAIDGKAFAMAEVEGMIRILGSTSEKNLEPGQKVKITSCAFDQTPKFTFAMA